MATGGSASVTSKLDCAVCLERYRRPKLLPCFHTFCQACLQTVAGTSSSFPCPACREPVIVPPGGVGALQTNFYIVDDLEKETTLAKLCDVCADQREATHKCLQCKQKYCGPCRQTHDAYTACRCHTITLYQPYSGQGGNTRNKTVTQRHEDKCLRHPKHELIMHCTKCKVNICIQCKLTSHEGHPTRDLEDEEAKVKVRLHERLERLSEDGVILAGVLATADSECRRLQEMRQQTEKDIRARADILIQWATQAMQTALHSIHIATEEHTARLRLRTHHERDQHAVVAAQCDHVTRVLDSDVPGDIVSLEAQLREMSVNRTEMLQLKDALKKEASGLTCRHSASAVTLNDMLTFVGVLEKAGSEVSTVASPGVQDDNTAGAPEKEEPDVATPPRDQAVVRNSQAADTATTSLQAVTEVKEAPRLITYSNDTRSCLLAICPTSQNRLWVSHGRRSHDSRVELFDEYGNVEEGLNDFAFTNAVTILEHITISANPSGTQLIWMQPGRSHGKIDMVQDHLRPACKSSPKGTYLMERRYCGKSNGFCVVSFTSLKPLTWKTERRLGKLPETVCDASANRDTIALITDKQSDSVTLYRKNRSGHSFYAAYTPGKGLLPKDACFCVIDERELLLVLVVKENKVHVIDHTDDCRLVGYLNTGSLALQDPRCLATDYCHYVWIGCNGGCVVRVSLSNNPFPITERILLFLKSWFEANMVQET